MTVAEARELLAKLPGNAPLCYSLNNEQGTILEIGQIDLVQVIGHVDGYVVTDDGAASRAAKVALLGQCDNSGLLPIPSD